MNLINKWKPLYSAVSIDPTHLQIACKSFEAQAMFNKTNEGNVLFNQYAIPTIANLFSCKTNSVNSEFNPKLFMSIPYDPSKGSYELNRVQRILYDVISKNPINGILIKFTTDMCELYI